MESFAPCHGSAPDASPNMALGSQHPKSSLERCVASAKRPALADCSFLEAHQSEGRGGHPFSFDLDLAVGCDAWYRSTGDVHVCPGSGLQSLLHLRSKENPVKPGKRVLYMRVPQRRMPEWVVLGEVDDGDCEGPRSRSSDDGEELLVELRKMRLDHDHVEADYKLHCIARQAELTEPNPDQRRSSMVASVIMCEEDEMDCRQ